MLASFGIRAMQACRVSSTVPAAALEWVIAAGPWTLFSGCPSAACPIAGAKYMATMNDATPIAHFIDGIVFIVFSILWEEP
jgi:hypothetical protein